ncbi:sigma-70 family RNA polymerase sigma factor [Nocardioides sp. TF02-7]|uniref:sigma-70 family RNA polymerase sigma factor n=1 Tax=Nocardioides sp. TF02-7 TaxID=2917724 RepID=UPI001F06A09B|nr:sigma-70 family RNA polymerase sigma factor [Nocardioides sp. TF02-7]UMG93349.1 sigma-70 family RNA polymerase sigma factor [Nocardioides sp. TF02-7]
MTALDQQRDLTEEFDAFYKDARDRLLLQAYALTGDLGAARSAVRDAFVVAWHHWRKLSRLDDPESSVRPHAWRIAQRRATTRPFHKEKNLGETERATLAALASLTVQQRRALLLTYLATASMSDMARELGLTVDAAQRELQTAASQVAMQRDIPGASIPLALAELGEVARQVTWPRVTIIRRAGAARRRMHTFVGAVGVVVVLVGSGVAVTDATGVRPTLDREPPPPSTAGAVTAGPDVTLPQSGLLPPEATDVLSGDWMMGQTHDNSAGTGLVLPCQPAGVRYADPAGEAAWVRNFRNGPPREATRRVTQLAEASRNDRRARAAYREVRDWVADCQTPGVRLEATEAARRVGDDSALLVLHAQEPTTRTYVVALARTGLYTTAVALTTDVGPGRADRTGVATLLGEAVDRLCSLPDGGTVRRRPVRPPSGAAVPRG